MNETNERNKIDEANRPINTINTTNGSHFWKHFNEHRLGLASLIVVTLFCVMGIYAPFLASSKPIIVIYDKTWYFPLLRYLFFAGFFTKKIDIFFNLMMFTLPAGLFLYAILRHQPYLRRFSVLLSITSQFILFAYFLVNGSQDPAADSELTKERIEERRLHGTVTWSFDQELKYMNDYAKLNAILSYRHLIQQDHRLQEYHTSTNNSEPMATLLQVQKGHQDQRVQRLKDQLKNLKKGSDEYLEVESSLKFITDRDHWLSTENQKISFELLPLIRPFHWEDDAGGQQAMNQYIPWWELTRINRKDLLAALIFGMRISLVVGILAVSLALMIGIPIGALAGFYGGKLDIVVCRLLEIWESMPTFFMLLLVVAMTQSKSIFIVITVIGLFGWTGFSRYVRGEFFKQRNLPYVEACHALGFSHFHIMFRHIIPNAIPPVLTILPFAIMGAITSEAGLSFLGLGEEGSCSWGVLMDEGRTAFPGESYLLWPPAIVLTVLLIAIALVGDAMRDALDPKMRR